MQVIKFNSKWCHQMLQNDVIKCFKMMSHSNNCCVVYEPAICEDLDLHVAIFKDLSDFPNSVGKAKLIDWLIDGYFIQV